MKNNIAKDILLGVSIGDALGVPVEFTSRRHLLVNPVTDMRAYGTHSQPAGTWSDDSSLTFCLAETLADEYDLQKLANRFVNWKHYSYWTPHGEVFDIGIATSAAIHDLSLGKDPVMAGGDTESSNGNGSLMRILPLLLYIKDMPVADRFEYVKNVSSLTHRHIRSVLTCFIYLEYALQLYNGKNKWEALTDMREIVNEFLTTANISQSEGNRFHRLRSIKVGPYDIRPIENCSEEEINSSGYVLDTLEASFWCLLTTDDYASAVLKAVNLGNDTDTTGAVAGGLAGILYGWESIPKHWLQTLARFDAIVELSEKLQNKFAQ